MFVRKCVFSPLDPDGLWLPYMQAYTPAKISYNNQETRCIVSP